jgi:hypothetical protein
MDSGMTRHLQIGSEMLGITYNAELKSAHELALDSLSDIRSNSQQSILHINRGTDSGKSISAAAIAKSKNGKDNLHPTKVSFTSPSIRTNNVITRAGTINATHSKVLASRNVSGLRSNAAPQKKVVGSVSGIIKSSPSKSNFNVNSPSNMIVGKSKIKSLGQNIASVDAQIKKDLNVSNIIAGGGGALVDNSRLGKSDILFTGTSDTSVSMIDRNEYLDQINDVEDSRKLLDQIRQRLSTPVVLPLSSSL